ncbi:MAG: DUF4157 domain-containing protein [Nostoc sp. GBBB01]|nr:DUF4157 domain-containing protein [Nostoc sp. GBBB01]
MGESEMSDVHRQGAGGLRKIGRRKTPASNSTNPSLVSRDIPTLANPTRGFGLDTNQAQRPIISTDFEEDDLLEEESLEPTVIQQPLNHDISKISLHSQDRFTNQPAESHQQQVGMMAAPAVQQKITPEPVETKQAFHSPVQQKPIQRDGMNIPGGATIETVNGNTSAVISLLDQKAIIALDNMPGARPPDFSRYIDRIDQVLSDTSLSDTNIPINFVETTGVNVYWRGYIRFRLGEPQPLSGGGSAATTRGFGGSTTSSTETSTSTTDSAKATASGGSTSGTKSGEAGKGGETSTGSSGTVGSEVSTTTSRSDKYTDSTTSSRGGTTNMTNNMQRFMAPLIAEISLNPELDVQGSDYVNPLKWGMFIGESIRPMKRVSGSVNCGSVTYYTSNGITPTPTLAAPPAQRKGWMENQLGITEQSQANFNNAAAVNNINPLQLSNSGSTPLPTDVAVAAQEHHGMSLDKVHLVQGGQADAYCDSMNAAAFTTPSNEGETNIFMHSQLPVDSPQGQHTLSHEVSHAVQQMRGETAELDGLGGNQSRRDALEKSADSHADIIVNKSAQLQKLQQSQ